MRVLVACEESQAVAIDLRRLVHDEYICDVISWGGGTLNTTFKWTPWSF